MITAADIISEVRTRLADHGDRTWTDQTLLNFVNAGIRQIIDVKPNSNVVSAEINVDNDIYKKFQYFHIPDDGKYLVDVTCIRTKNKTNDKITSAVGCSLVDRQDLENKNPRWLEIRHNSFDGDTVYDPDNSLQRPRDDKLIDKLKVNRFNYMFDNDDPSIFYISPNFNVVNVNNMETSACVRYQSYPGKITMAQLGTDLSDITYGDGGELNIGNMENYQTALFKWVIYEAYMVNSSSRNFMDRAKIIYRDFYDTLGVQTKSEMMSDPNLHIIEGSSIQRGPVGSSTGGRRQ